jgi:hypothetical protein
MTVYYPKITALIDPEQSEPLPDGGRWQEVSVILIDDDHAKRTQAAITLAPEDARELAFDLLILAEHAQRERTVEL